MESNTDFSTEHLNIFAIEALPDRVVHAAQELAAVDARLCRQARQIDFVVLWLEVRAALAAQTGLKPGQDAIDLLLDRGVSLGLDTGHQLVFLNYGVAVHLRRRHCQRELLD